MVGPAIRLLLQSVPFLSSVKNSAPDGMRHNRCSQATSVQKMAPPVRQSTVFHTLSLQGAMYSLHLQHRLVNLHSICLHKRITTPPGPSPKLPHLRRSPTPFASARSRFAYALRASAAESPNPDPPQVTNPTAADHNTSIAELRFSQISH